MTTPRHLTYDSLEAWVEGEHLPKDWTKHTYIAQRKLWWNQFAELKQHLWTCHLTSLSEVEQQEFKNGTHPSLSHEFSDRAKPFIIELQNELARFGYKAEVMLVYYHLNRIILGATLDKTPPGRSRGVPWLFRGFEVQYRFPDTHDERNAK
jgi:hypothetical protein